MNNILLGILVIVVAASLIYANSNGENTGVEHGN